MTRTALGGDNRRLRRSRYHGGELAKQKLDHPPITLLFCVRRRADFMARAREDRRAWLAGDGLQLTALCHPM